MFSSRRIKLLLSIIFAASSVSLLIRAYPTGNAKDIQQASDPVLKSKILRRKDRLPNKLSTYEEAVLRKRATLQEERQLEDKIPKHVPIRVKLKSDKEKAFKDLDNPKWYRDFELEVTNTSDKAIYYLEVWLVYPEINSGNGAPVGVPLRYGRMKFISQDTRPLPSDVPIQPGETHVFTIPEKDRLGWEWHKRNENTPDPKKVVLSFVQLSFGDGTGFEGTDAKKYPYEKNKTSSLACREGPAPIVATGPVREQPIGFQATLRNQLLFPITGKSSAGYFYAFDGSYSFLGESSVTPDACCGSGCYFMKPTMDICVCGDSRGFAEPGCSDPQATCGIPVEVGHWCDDYGVYCPEYTRGPCATSSPTPTPPPTPPPTPRASPSPTPCPVGSFNPYQNGNCPYYANKVNGCCICQQTTDCSTFGQGTFSDGTPYCMWVESLCDCYNIDGPCRDNPRPSPTQTAQLSSGGESGGNNEGGGHEAGLCTEYWWVWFYLDPSDNQWKPTGEVEYAGCW